MLKTLCLSVVNGKITLLAESGEGDPHRLPRLRTKVGGRRPRADPTLTPPSSKTMRQNPYSVNAVWGIRRINKIN